jgi:hypothetical protein
VASFAVFAKGLSKVQTRKFEGLIATVNSLFIVLVFLFRPVAWFEARIINTNDLFASGASWFSAPNYGVVTLLGVPVFSSEFDLGKGVPQSQSWGFSGFVLLRHIMPQSMIVVTCVGVLMWIFSITLMNLFRNFEIGRRYAVASLTLHNASLLWTITRYDWYIHLVSILAISLLVLMIVRAELWLSFVGQHSRLVKPIDYRGLIGFSLAASISHYATLCVIMPIISLAAVMRTRQYFPLISQNRGKLAACLLPCMVSLASFLLQYRELSDYVSARRQAPTSFPPFAVRNLKHLAGQFLQGELPIVGSFVPGLSDERFVVQISAYVGLLPIVVTASALLLGVKTAFVNHCKSRLNLLGHYVVALVASVVLLFGWPIKLLFIQRLPGYAEFWLLMPAVFGSTLAPLVLGLVHRDTEKRTIGLKLLLGSATGVLITLGLLHSWSAVKPDLRTRPVSLVSIQQQSSDVVHSTSNFGQVSGYRLLNLAGFPFDIGHFRDAGLVTLALPTKLRRGNSLISGSSVLVDQDEQAKLSECPNDVVDFLGAKVVIANSQVAERCSSTSKFHLPSSFGQMTVLSFDRFHSWWADGTNSKNCQLLDSGCLAFRSLRRGSESEDTPLLSFAVDKADGLLASVKVPNEKSGGYLVVPLSAGQDWDVFDRDTNSRIQSIDVAGLLGIPTEQLELLQSTEIGIRYQRDLMDWVVALTPWIWILSVVFASWIVYQGRSVQDRL